MMSKHLNQIEVFPEPKLEFTDGQTIEHPAAGLGLFGPVETKGIQKPDRINYAVVGTLEGIERFKGFAKLLNGAVLTPEAKSPDLWPHYPGFEEVTHAEFSADPELVETLSGPDLQRAVVEMDDHKRVYGVADIYLAAIEALAEKDSRVDVVVCVVPEVVFKNCRPLSKVKEGRGNRVSAKELKMRKQGGDLFGSYNPEHYDFSLDFRRQIKARAMAYKIPIQIVRETTLRLSDENELGQRGLTFLSDRAWNLTTALLYKSGRKPWKLSGVREGVCYVGIAFKRTNDVGNTACSAAQMFLNDGDGIVFLGESGQWYSPDTKNCHLSRDAAKRLLEGVLKTYERQHGQKLKEVFLHSRSEIDYDEWSGYQAACPEGVKLVCVRVASDRGLRLYRGGDYPIMRGTFWKISEKAGFLWGTGFKPILKTYEGSDVPAPLKIEIQYGDADIRTVAKDIFGLTKLNYNTCKLGESQPVTVHFSDAVGEIIVANKGAKHFLPNFKYYV